MQRNIFTIKLIAISLIYTGASPVFAQLNATQYPERTIQMIIPFGPGGATDIMARLLQDELGKALGSNASRVIATPQEQTV
jgi:tripartite-type tricarboxylate transporter receptor subunit TctC